MGLWITKVLMEKMNGSVSIESKFGKGTTLKIVFPVRAE
jgi:signal transduction histidine kinase